MISFMIFCIMIFIAYQYEEAERTKEKVKFLQHEVQRQRQSTRKKYDEVEAIMHDNVDITDHIHYKTPKQIQTSIDNIHKIQERLRNGLLDK